MNIDGDRVFFERNYNYAKDEICKGKIPVSIYISTKDDRNDNEVPHGPRIKFQINYG